MRLTVEEAQKKNERIDFLKSRLEKIRNERSDFQGSAGYDSNEPYFALLSQMEDTTNKEIMQINQELATAEIVDPTLANENLVNDGDTIDLLVTFADGTVLSNTVKVVNHIEEYQPNVVTTSSPIGMAIYGKELGSVVDCKTPNGNIKIQIMGKALKEEQEETLGR